MKQETFEILAVLSRGSATTVQILDELERLSGTPPSLATFYRRLKQAMDDGLIHRVGHPTDGTEGAGRPAQLFELTQTGLVSARQEAMRLSRLVDFVGPGGAEP